MVCTCDQASTAATPRTEPAVIAARPPWRSSHRPTGIAAMAATRMDTVAAPVTAAIDACRSAAIGVSRTEKA